MKVKNNCSYPEARRIVASRTPKSGVSYANAAKKVTRTFGTQTESASLPFGGLPPITSNKKKIRPNLIAATEVDAKKASVAKSKALKAYKLKQAKQGAKKFAFTTEKALLSLEADAITLHPSDDEIVFDDASEFLQSSSGKGAFKFKK